jgi:uncharacterized protein YceK
MKKKLLTMLVLMATMTGCLSTTYHFSGENEYPYNATVDSFNWCICVWGNVPVNETEKAMDAYTRMVYPFWILDFPFEVVLDTVFLVPDAIIYGYDNNL